MDEVRNLIIIGSGPAGYTAAVYAARANLKPLIIEGVQSGGALMTTTEVENFPGFADGILGPELMDNMRKQAERFGAEFLTDDVTRVELVDTGDAGSGAVSTVWVGETAYRARSIILSTGSAWRPLGVPGEQEYLGHGVSSCATCDGFFFRNQHIVVVGGGDSAMEEATFLTRFAESVTIIHRRDSFRASKIMADRALSNEKIKVEWNSTVEEILGDDGKVTGVRRPQRAHRRDQGAGRDRRLRRHRPRPSQRAVPGPGRDGRRGLREGPRPEHPHQRARCLRRRRRRRPHLPSGDHRGRHRLCRRARRRAVHRDAQLKQPNTSGGGAIVGTTKAVTDASFVADVLQADKPVLVDFWAEWCGPCRKVSPLLEEIAGEMGDQVTIVKLNIDENPETARAYRVMSVPTLTVFKNGQPVQSIAGAKPKGELVRLIESAL